MNEKMLFTVKEVLFSCTCCMFPSPLVGEEGGCSCCPCDLHDSRNYEVIE